MASLFLQSIVRFWFIFCFHFEAKIDALTYFPQIASGASISRNVFQSGQAQGSAGGGEAIRDTLRPAALFLCAQ